MGLPYYAGIARVAERGLMDAIFLADNIAIAEYRTTYLPQTQFDPISVLSALAAVTSDIGLIGTGSTTYSKPWELARRLRRWIISAAAERAGTSSPPSRRWPRRRSARPPILTTLTATRALTNSSTLHTRLGQLGGRCGHR